MTARRLMTLAAAALAAAATASAQTPPRLTLSDAEQRALAGHPGVIAAQAAAQAAQQTVREARSVYWPTLFGSITGAAAPDNTRITAGALNNPSIFDRFALAQSGLRSGLDLSFARVNLSQAQLLRVQADGDVQSAFATLNTAMGAPQTSTYALVEEPLTAPSSDDASVVIAQALRDRPDVAAEQIGRAHV